MPTYASLVKISNLPAATLPTTPGTNLAVLSQGSDGLAYKISINDFVSGATASSFTIGTATVTGNASVGGTLGITGAVSLSSTLSVTGTSTLGTVNASGIVTLSSAGTALVVTNDATVGGALGVTGTGTFAGSLIAGNAGAAPITLSSGIISVPASQSLSIRLTTAAQTITFGAPSAGLGQSLTVTPNSNGNSLFGAAPSDVLVSNRLTVTTLRTVGTTVALSGTVTPTAFSGTGSTATVTFATIAGIVIPVGSTITITGATPAGYNTTNATVTASTLTTVSWASTATGALSVAGSMAYNIASPRIVSMQTNWSGTAAAGTQWYPYTFGVPSDTADTGNTGSGAPLMYLSHNWGGAAKGSKQGLRMALTHTSTTNDPQVPGVVNQQHVAGEFWGTTAFNAGGTGSASLAAGSFYGLNPQILLQQGATNWRLANALGEVNLAVYASSRTLTLGGTVTAGDTLSLQFTSADIVGSPVTVSWTTGASQTLPMVANNLVTAIMANAALTNAKISAARSGSVVTIYWDTNLAALTITPSLSGGATETMTLGTAVPGASVDVKLMGSLIRLAEDTAPPEQDSAFLLMTGQPGSGTAGLFNNGLVFGGLNGYGGEWSWHAGSTMIGVGLSNSYGGSGKTNPLIPNLAKYGIDYKNIAFAGNGGAVMRWSGGSISDTGGLFVGGYTVAATSTALVIDAAGRTATSVALASGGGGGAGVATSNYFIGDVGFDDYGGVYRVATVNTSTGAVATFTTLVSPAYTSGAAPANPLTVSGGSGANWTVNATWPSAAVVQIQASGNATIFGNATTPITPTSAGTTYTPNVQILATGAAASSATARFSANANGSRIALVKSRNASIGGHTAVQSADDLGRFEWYGDDGTDYLAGARVSAIVDGAVSAGVVPTALVSYTAASGSTPTERFRIGSDGILQGAAPSWSANGAVATVLTGIGPTGSHTTVQEWFTVKNAAGVTRYIPAF